MNIFKSYLAKRKEYFIKPNYISRLQPEYFFDAQEAQTGRIYQPQVYPLAFFLARRFGCDTIIDIGSGNAEKLIVAHPEFHIIGLDFGSNLQMCRQKYPFGEWLEWDIDHNRAPHIPSSVLEKSVIICSDVIEHLIDPSQLLITLKKWLDVSPVAILSTPDRDLARGVDDQGPPANTAHVREWNKKELNDLINHYDLYTEFIGHTINNSISNQKRTILAVLRSNRVQIQHKKIVPQDFRVVALLTTYNDEDIIIPILSNLLKQEVKVYVIDNWSNDQTWQRIQEFQHKNPGIIGMERYPESAPDQYMWTELLQRKEQLACEIPADWYIHTDSDEIRLSPWQNCSLRKAIYRVDQEGFNVIDFTVVNFYPITAEDFPDQANPEDFFQYFDFGHRPAHFVQFKAWKKNSAKVDLASSGGHDAKFDGRKVYPYKFLLKHYSILSQSHGELKIFEDRQIRTKIEFAEKGWHSQYNRYSQGHNFISDPQELLPFDEMFYSTYLIERLSGIGITDQENKDAPKLPREDQNGLFFKPNQYARPASFEVGNELITIHGYQEFNLTEHTVTVLDTDENLKNKYNLLKPYFTHHNLQGRSFLDLGANGGFFSFLALQNGAENVIALDMDEEYLEIIKKSRDTMGFQRLTTINSNLSDWSAPAGVVLALALIHWVYSCTAIFGSLDAVIKKLANLTEYLLIIEWVDPADQAIEFFHHIQWNQDNIQEPYTFSAFEKALSSHFTRYELIGEISSTRKIFAAYKSPYVLDYSCPLPLICPKEYLISSRLISYNLTLGISYWSCVYLYEDKIYKQATLDLAKREAYFLERLQGSEYFPRVLDRGMFNGEYSTIVCEYVVGKPMTEAVSEVVKSPYTFFQFILHALNCLEQLENAGITHRDIELNNILIRNEKPVIIDFGWAISDEYPYITPPGLTDRKTPPDGSFSNIYQMGIVFEKINDHKYLYFDHVISRMIDSKLNTRTEDIAALRRLFDLVYRKYYFENKG